MKRWALLVLVAGSACRCRDGGIDPTQAGYRVETQEIDFGKVLEGDSLSKDITVIATSASDITIDLATDPPFNVQPIVNVPGGSSNTVAVKFTAGTLPVTGEVRLSANNAKATVKLKGIGVRPKVCTASGPCKVSTYQIDTDTCLETEAGEGAACQPESVCLEKGECHGGKCQGVARTCDDQSACTIDSCAMDVGCVHQMRACPAPTQACRVAACDPVMGCGTAQAPDGTPCGTVDCVKALLCVGGACTEVPTPEGFVCGAATPCQAEPKCKNQKCVGPDAGLMMPRTTVKLPGVPVDERPSLVAQAGNVYFQLCGLPPLPDAGVKPPDAGVKDAGTADAGADGGESDGGENDAGEGDAGPPPVPFDGGFCALTSYTGTGFERWTSRYPDLAPRKLIHAGSKGVVLQQEGALEIRTLATGVAARVPIAGTLAPRGIAQNLDLEVWALVTSDDAGPRLVRFGDGGVLPELPLDAGASLLAIDEDGTAWLYAPDAGTLGWLKSDDAGWHLGWTNGVAVGNASLVAAEGRVVAGARALFHADDGGVLAFDWVGDAGAPQAVLDRFSVAGERAGVILYRECEFPLTSCAPIDEATWAYAYRLDDGRFLFRVKVLPSGVEGRVEEVALAGLQPGAFATLVNVFPDGGPTKAFLEGYADGKRVLLCAFQDHTLFGGAVFTPSALHTLVNRDGGAWLLETYDLGAAPVLQQGWPQADGLGGTRRAR